MLSELILENFKAFSKRQVIPLAPITLLFGANSAGKSSVLQSLLLLKQTWAQAQYNEQMLVPRGPWVDLGNFREMVFDHDMSRTIEIAPLLGLSAAQPKRSLGTGFQFQYDEADKVIELVGLPFYQGGGSEPAYRLKVAASRESARKRPYYFGIMDERSLTEQHPFWEEVYAKLMQGNGYVDMLRRAQTAVSGGFDISEDNDLHNYLEDLLDRNIDYGTLGVDETLNGEILQTLSNELDRMARYEMSMLIEDIRRLNQPFQLDLQSFLPMNPGAIEVVRDERGWLSWDELMERWLSKPVSVYHHSPAPSLTGLNFATSWALRHVLQTMVYLGPLRESPERYNIFSGNESQEVGKSGQMLPDLLFRREELVEQTNMLLNAFEIGYTIDVVRGTEAGLESIYALRLVDKRGITLSVRDVGFGISQVLPIIVQSTLSKNQVILIEQPELHLHPRLQAELGTLFARCIGAPHDNQFIIETHSEHLILRLQRLIRHGQLKASDVSVVYVMQGDDGSHCYPLRLDIRGDFVDAWPEGFFEEGYREVFG